MQKTKIPYLKPIKKTDNLTLADFWNWAYSDLLHNTIRPVFAEFIVGAALGVIDRPRIGWDAYDLLYKGKRIEVKCSAYLQSWQQEKPWPPRFDIAKRHSWFAESNTYSAEAIRATDCYVFCVYREKDLTKADVLDLDMWSFYVLSREKVDEFFGEQKSVGLSRLKTFCEPVIFEGLKEAVDLATATTEEYPNSKN